MSSLVKHCGYCYSIRRSRSTSRGEEEKRSLDWKFSAQEYEYLCKELQDRRCYWNCNYERKSYTSIAAHQIPILPVDYLLYLFMCFSIKKIRPFEIFHLFCRRGTTSTDSFVPSVHTFIITRLQLLTGY